jgi:hypothetical protein
MSSKILARWWVRFNFQVRELGFGSMRVAAIFLLLLAGCNLRSNQWVLQSYDQHEGYIFTKDGVQYQASCFATGTPMLGAPPNETPDTNPEAMPPNVAHAQDDCGDILVYLHKPVPNLRQVGGSILLLTEEKNYRLEFEIKHAK